MHTALSLERASNCTNLLHFESVSKYSCMEQPLVLSDRVEFLPYHIHHIHRVEYREEHRLSSSLEAFSSCNSSISYKGFQFISVPDVVDVLNKPFP